MTTTATFLTPAGLVARWDGAVSVGTLANWRAQSRGPGFTKIGSKVAYPLDQVEAYERELKGGKAATTNTEDDKQS